MRLSYTFPPLPRHSLVDIVNGGMIEMHGSERLNVGKYLNPNCVASPQVQ